MVCGSLTFVVMHFNKCARYDVVVFFCQRAEFVLGDARPAVTRAAAPIGHIFYDHLGKGERVCVCTPHVICGEFCAFIKFQRGLIRIQVPT